MGNDRIFSPILNDIVSDLHAYGFINLFSKSSTIKEFLTAGKLSYIQRYNNETTSDTKIDAPSNNDNYSWLTNFSERMD